MVAVPEAEPFHIKSAKRPSENTGNTGQLGNSWTDGHGKPRPEPPQLPEPRAESQRHRTGMALLAAVASLSLAATPWPHPSQIDAGASVLSVSADFALEVTNPTGAHKHLHSTAKRYSEAITSARGDGCNATVSAPQLKKCTVTVKDTSVPLAAGIKEGYALQLGADGQCLIEAQTVWGAFHGMESLAQLAAENCTISNAPVAISDTPRFGFRGL